MEVFGSLYTQDDIKSHEGYEDPRGRKCLDIVQDPVNYFFTMIRRWQNYNRAVLSFFFKSKNIKVLGAFKNLQNTLLEINDTEELCYNRILR